MSVDTMQGDFLQTPKVQKCLFGSGGSSSRKKSRRVYKNIKISDSLSEEESDLGHMSPLALTDQSPSSQDSSPRNSISSPCTTPKTSSLFNIHLSWKQMSQSVRRKNVNDYVLCNSVLKKSSQDNRLSEQQNTLSGSSKSSRSTPLRNSCLYTPEKSQMCVSTDEIMQRTPERQFGKELQNNGTETPKRSKNLEQKLTTPLTSENKLAILPKLHRRKSFGTFEAIPDSPERKESALKRHALEELENTAKLMKTNENCSVPKARAALFQDKIQETNLKNFTLSTKSFYSNSDEKKKNYRFFYELPEQKHERKSLAGYTIHSRRHIRRNSLRGINAGVSHGIKKPKPKAHSRNNVQMEQTSPEIERSPSPEFDLTKRFFKLKRALKRNASGTVTISKNVKLKVAENGELTLSNEHARKKQHYKQAKPVDISFDTTDLTVDEPEMEATIEQNNVANILKVLEDDWADDDYDIMEVLTNKNINDIPPLAPTALEDVTMLPVNEMDDMNITDISTSLIFKNISLDDNENTVKEDKPKYYPIFSKGYSADKPVDDVSKKPMQGKKESTNWQLSVKRNGDENQCQLDAGQKNFGATQCTECGIVYQIGDPEDENAHLNYHNHRKSLKFFGWKTERVIMEDPITSSRIILVEPDDPKQYWNKVTEVLAYVDRDLGLADTSTSEYENKKVYLYIRDKTIIGVLVAEHITTAYRMIPELLELNCCTAESTPAKCGINVVWTDMNHRRQGIATKLVDILRSQFYYGYIMSMDDIAFSIPTVSGKVFAEKYTKTRNFKVYS
ncbi:establishment of cohesion [Calliopsis andreniformis]|uniref:establishment of cohesion n=1 Tax=Calliopsis andreniformis TaxID=337506 RepID=UPI003FCD3D10